MIPKTARFLSICIAIYLFGFRPAFGASPNDQLINDLKSSNVVTRQKAASALGKVNGDPRAVSALIDALKDTDRTVRYNAIYALGSITPKTKAAVHPVILALEDQDAAVRQAAVYNLGVLGSAHPNESIPALIRMLKTKDNNLCWEAIMALGKIGPNSGKAVPDLILKLNDKEKEIAGQAKIALAMIGTPEAIKAVRENSGADAVKPALASEITSNDMITALQDETAFNRILSANGYLGEKVKPAAIPLIEALKNKEVLKRERAAYLLAKIGPSLNPVPEGSIVVLTGALKDENRAVRRDCLYALGHLSFTAKDAVPAIILCLKDPDIDVQRASIDALGKIGQPGARHSIPALVQIIEKQNHPLRQTAMRSFTYMGTAANAAVPAFAKAMEDKDKGIRELAASVLEEMGTADAKKALASRKK